VTQCFRLRQVWQSGGYVQCLRSKGVLEKIVVDCGGLASSSKKMRKLYEVSAACCEQKKGLTAAFPFPPLTGALLRARREADCDGLCAGRGRAAGGAGGHGRPDGLLARLRRRRREKVSRASEGWRLGADAVGDRAFDVVEEIWVGLGENAEKLVGVLVGILQSGEEERRTEQALRMVQELSYEHEDFARALVKAHSRVLAKMAQAGSERVQALACKALQNVSWWKVRVLGFRSCLCCSLT
jgi:hypothetical protein